MRIRRVRTGRIPIRSIPSTGTISYPTLHHEITKPQTAGTLISHTMHPDSQRWELGLAKYSTGIFAVPKLFRKQTTLSHIGLKIYSTALVEKQSIKQALLSALQNSTQSENLSSYLRQAWEITHKIRSISETIVDAFFQIFERPKAKKAGFGSLGGRQWNFSLRLHRSHDHGKLLGRPFALLQSNGIPVMRRCEYQGKSFGHCSVSFELSFHLRHKVGTTTTDETESTNLRTESHHDTFQELVDNLLAEQLKAIEEKTSTDAEHLVSNVSNALLRDLVASPLANLVDFHHLEVVLTNIKCRERVVKNVLLSDDGTPRHAVADQEQRPPSSARTSLTGQSSANDAFLSGDEASKVHQAQSVHNDVRQDGVFVALGSNLGDRLQNIESACSEIDSDPDMQIRRTSALYETAPMYVEDQNQFLNGVCEISTSLPPLVLLDRLQAIEHRLGRVKIVEKGPRNIDLDILIYRGETVGNERLQVPHALMQEREFVLRPLCDIPNGRDQHITALQTDGQFLLDKLPTSSQPIHAISYLDPSRRNIRVSDPQNQTRLMSIVNVTPDSFSDGGVHDPTNKETLVSLIRAQLEAGTVIVDIGGQSSRPNAPDVTAEEEIARIVPAIEVVKSMPEAESVTISVDTYRATVAETAIKAGAHVINDISAGKLDPDMLSTVAKLGCTYVMMHMRGTPATMMSEENCTYSEGLIKTIENELFERVEAAQEAGVRRWRIILDPGIGFSKTAEHNVELLRKFSQLKNCSRLRNFAWLVGSSRKSFIGKLTGVEDPKARGWGTAATVTAAIQGGADIVRVHDAREMNAVVKMADAMYRY